MKKINSLFKLEEENVVYTLLSKYGVFYSDYDNIKNIPQTIFNTKNSIYELDSTGSLIVPLNDKIYTKLKKLEKEGILTNKLKKDISKGELKYITTLLPYQFKSYFLNGFDQEVMMVDNKVKTFKNKQSILNFVKKHNIDTKGMKIVKFNSNYIIIK